MNRPGSILVAVAVAAWLACPPAGMRGAALGATAGQVATGTHKHTEDDERARQEAVEAQQTRARVEQLARLETAQRLHSEIEARRGQELLGLQAAQADAWATVLRTNGPAYQALLQKAALSPQHSTLCTFCDGRNQMPFCILCANSGKCVRCNGSGRTLGDPCPACRGKGKCFLCFGSGRMTCPFCEAGFVYYRKGPPPPVTIPMSPVSILAASPQSNPAEQPSLATGAGASGPAGESDSPAQPPPVVAPLESSGPTFVLAVALFLCGILLIRKFAPGIAEYLNARFNPWPALATAANHSPQILAEEQVFSDFLAEFRIGPHAAALSPLAAGGPANSGPGEEPAKASEPGADSLKAFLASAPKQIRDLLKLLQELSRAPEEAGRKEMLSRLGGELHRLKGMAGLPELLPAWQMTCALEWLVKQLTEKDSRITPSTLRTVANGVDLLMELCRPGVRADVCTNPPIRVLAVDDDAISRHALAFALKKGGHPPDLAEDGPAALALAARQPYDVIFLDVQMPGMDGFEVCSRIHDTLPNRSVPVVFVTVLSDFDTRAKSSLCGGTDLIGKPFLTFEITVKALTLALRGRLHVAPSSAEACDATTGSDAAAAITIQSEHSGAQIDPARVRSEPADSTAITPKDSAADFFAYAAAQIEAGHELVQRARQTPEGDRRQTVLVDLYRRVCSLRPPPECGELQPALQVIAALESLLKKLLEHPKNTSSSTLQTLATAMDLLGDLCVPGFRADLACNPPVHLLVVDDDPVACRAIASGLQLTFARPDSAPGGEAALALATEKTFDVIFMDVEMPGMDGLTASVRIHERAANRHTPIVFVSAHTDADTRRATVQCGGCDFIAKPFLCSELTLKALTLTLRGRLQKLGPAEGPVPAPTEEEACLTEAY